MNADELKQWLEGDESMSSGWQKDDGSGETIGHERCAFQPSYTLYQLPLTVPSSGRKIIKILEKNPQKDPAQYDEEDIEHMRRVVAYCKRHLAQEEKAKRDTESKSYK